MHEPTSDNDPSAFPVIALLDALDGWCNDPTEPSRAALAVALAGAVRATGARGAYLNITAPPLPAFEAGAGSLEERPTASRPGVTSQALTAQAGNVLLGTLWLDAGGEAGELAARCFELVLDAAWSRAEVESVARRLDALDEATRGISEVLEIEQVLQRIVDRVAELVGARYAALGIMGPAGQIERFITHGVTPEERRRIGGLPRGHGLLGLIIREGRSYRIPDIAHHPDSYGFPPEHPPMHSFLGVPITVTGRSIGNLYLTEKRFGAEFSVADQRLVEMFALHAGIAIENARLHEQVQRLAIVDERDRIGKDLHDGIIQGIYAVTLSLEDVPDLMADEPAVAVARIDRAIDALHLTIRDIRNFILGLQSEALGGVDLEAGLATLVHEVRLNSIIDVDLVIDEEVDAGAGFPAAARDELLMIAREGLSNMVRHSAATRGRVELVREAARLQLVVADNGRGFEVASTGQGGASGPGHMGLVNVRERAAAIGATLRIESRPGTGTRIIIVVPVPPTSEPAGPGEAARS